MEPNSPGMDDMCMYVAEELIKLGVAYIYLVHHSGIRAPASPYDLSKSICNIFKVLVIAGSGLEMKEYGDLLLEKACYLVYFRRSFVSNTNLIKRLKKGERLIVSGHETSYNLGDEWCNTCPLLGW